MSPPNNAEGGECKENVTPSIQAAAKPYGTGELIATVEDLHRLRIIWSTSPCSQIFHGRNTELQDVVNILVRDTAHVAILGAGGMGKTSLAITALHNLQVEAKYTQQYFVPFHSSPTYTELAATIADHIGLEKGSNMAKNIAHHFAHAPPSLLILNNLHLAPKLKNHPEGCRATEKSQVGQALLGPSGPTAFIAVLDDGYDDASIKELLELTGNLSLAVSLIASVAGSKGCAQALSHWKSESTRMLSDSSQMTSGAQELLSILSMLPDGLTDADLLQAKLPITDIDVHRWRAACMVRIADILHGHGEVMKSVELQKAARPLFERSSQTKDIAQIDAKLAEADPAVLTEYAQLQRLSELHVPGSESEEANVAEDETEAKMAEGSDFRGQGVLV
ncbi:hypothetical protein C8J57DRAFT_1624963 [Mycena rebaudengoi]|nr:hypothetical protein C8J57DRAFT_1624963 [Mycena rebaudengoi]